MIPTIEEILRQMQAGTMLFKDGMAYMEEHVKAIKTEAQKTLRDEFAMAALQGILAKSVFNDKTWVANRAYSYANEMIKERDSS